MNRVAVSLLRRVNGLNGISRSQPKRSMSMTPKESLEFDSYALMFGIPSAVCITGAVVMYIKTFWFDMPEKNRQLPEDTKPKAFKSLFKE